MVNIVIKINATTHTSFHYYFKITNLFGGLANCEVIFEALWLLSQSVP